jgi:hypothetical protein
VPRGTFAVNFAPHPLRTEISMSYLQDQKPVTLFELGRMRSEKQRIAMLTAYDASFAALVERCGVDVILIGDSLGNVLQGQKSTLPVTLDHMAYHTECVARGSSRALVLSDLPFGSYHENPEQAMRSAARLMAAGAWVPGTPQVFESVLIVPFRDEHGTASLEMLFDRRGNLVELQQVFDTGR